MAQSSKLTPEQRAVFEQRRRNHCRQIGILGGEATKRKYCGPSGATGYYREIGKAGFQALCEKYELNRAQGRKLIRLLNDPDRKVRQPHGVRFAALLAEVRSA